MEMLGYKDWDICHDEMYQWLEDSKNDTRKLLLIPRGHLKSSIVTVGLSIQDVLVNPNKRILIANAIWDNARGFVRQIGDYFNGFSDLNKVFGDFKGKRGGRTWNKDSITIMQRTIPLKEATITATGVERTQASQHYDKIVLDDVVARENIGTKEQRNKIIDFYGDCLSLLEPGGEVVVIGTTWHEDDLYNVLRVDDKYKTYVRTALEPKHFSIGKPIFPKKFSRESILDIKHEFEKKGKLGQFYAQYFLDPYPDEEAEFQKEHIQYYDEVPKCAMHISLVLDPSLGKAASDNSAIGITGVTQEGKIYILEARNFKVHIDMIGNEIVKSLIELKNKGLSANIIGIEGFGFQAALETPIRTALVAGGFGHVYMEILPRSTEESKDSRIMSLIPYFADRRIYMKQNMVDLKDEMIRFKKNVKRRKDDILDTLAWQINYWSRRPVDKVKESCPEGSYGHAIKMIRESHSDNKTLREEFGLN